MAYREVRKCQGCDVEYVAHEERSIVCMACNLMLKAAGPSEQLIDMRMVYKGVCNATVTHVKLRELFEKEPLKFMDRLNKLETEYRGQALKWEQARNMKAQAVKWDGQGVCPSCKRGTIAEVVVDSSTKSLIGKAEQWLTKYKEASVDQAT